ncbi:MAG: succinate dehydrogenase [Acidobacteria bacterium]|nr:succinate dehydrogenase [Acidobacteriota bacterium]MBI3427086.1 succinate dehydrogenase [Acidobacteriota bacterium]
MAESRTALQSRRFGATFRRDAWWTELLPVIFVLGGFGVYATFRAFEGAHYEWGPYLSPLYSPLFKPRWWPFSPAILILMVPLGFRSTCYYYRKAYYRAFFLTPPSCAVTGRGAGSYSGERKFPFILQNLHRYFLYLALIFIAILAYDALRAFWFADGFGVGVGTLIMVVNVVYLGAYTLSCHSLRHLIGGKLDCFSCEVAGATRYKAWRLSSFLNERHMLYGWISVFTVALTDLYIMLVARGVITDWRIL